MIGSISSFYIPFILLTGFLLSFLLMPWLIRLAFRLHIIDHPDDRKLHEEGMPLFGGVAISISLFICGALFLEYSNIVWALLSGFIIIFLTGLADDIWHLRPVLKFAGEIIASLVFLYIADVNIFNFGNLLGTGELTTGRFAVPASVFCMVGVMNALNMVDGLDGLAGGLSAIACVFLGWFAWQSGFVIELVLLVSLLGSLLGFLYYNFYPARIFMGDTGSLVLGYLLSAICILLVQDHGSGYQILPVSMAIILGLPIVDAILVMTLRMLKGHSPFEADHTHLHHRIQRLGTGHRGTVIVMYLIMVVCCSLAIFAVDWVAWAQFGTGILLVILIYGTVGLLEAIQVNSIDHDMSQ